MKSNNNKGLLALLGWLVAVASLVAAFTGHMTKVVFNVKQWLPHEQVKAPTISGWTHYHTKSFPDLLERVNLLGEPPENLAVRASDPDLHLWYRTGGRRTEYEPGAVEWKNEEHPTGSYF